MTHLSDFSYLERGFQCLLVLIVSLLNIEKFADSGLRGVFSYSKFRTLNIKTLGTFMWLISLVLWIIYDIICTTFKYQYEPGFPTANMSAYHQDLADASDWILNVSWTLRNSSCFVLLATFHSVVTIKAGEKFGSTVEFTIYRAYSVFSLFLYPFMTLFFSFNVLLKVVMPQMVYITECVVICILLQYVNRRMGKALEVLKQPSTRMKFKYWRIMNTFMSVTTMLEAIGLGIINVDIMFAKLCENCGDGVVLGNKFLTDFFTVIFSIGNAATFLLIAMILYPIPIDFDGYGFNNKRNRNRGEPSASSSHKVSRNARKPMRKLATSSSQYTHATTSSAHVEPTVTPEPYEMADLSNPATKTVTKTRTASASSSPETYNPIP